MSLGKTRQVPELLKYSGVNFPTATSGSQTFDCPVIKFFFDGIKFASFEIVLSGWIRIVSHNASDKVILPRLFQIWRHFQVAPV